MPKGEQINFIVGTHSAISLTGSAAPAGTTPSALWWFVIDGGKKQHVSNTWRGEDGPGSPPSRCLVGAGQGSLAAPSAPLTTRSGDRHTRARRKHIAQGDNQGNPTADQHLVSSKGPAELQPQNANVRNSDALKQVYVYRVHTPSCGVHIFSVSSNFWVCRCFRKWRRW